MDLDDCVEVVSDSRNPIINLCGGDFVNIWNSKVVKDYLLDMCMHQGEHYFEETIDNYKRVLKKQCLNHKQKMVIKERILNHIIIFHTFFLVNDGVPVDKGFYLDKMEKLLLYWVNLEMDSLRILKKKKMNNKDYIQTIRSCAQRCIDNLDLHLLGDERTIFHVLLRLNNADELDPIKEFLHFIYTYYLSSVPVVNKSDIYFSRHYLLFQKWKYIRDPSTHSSLDKILYFRFDTSQEQLYTNRVLRKILSWDSKLTVIIDVLVTGANNAVDAYFKYIKDRRNNSSSIIMDSDTDSDEPLLISTVDAKSSVKPEQSTESQKIVPFSSDTMVCIIDDDDDAKSDSDVELISVETTNVPKRKMLLKRKKHSTKPSLPCTYLDSFEAVSTHTIHSSTTSVTTSTTLQMSTAKPTVTSPDTTQCVTPPIIISLATTVEAASVDTKTVTTNAFDNTVTTVSTSTTKCSSHIGTIADTAFPSDIFLHKQRAHSNFLSVFNIMYQNQDRKIYNVDVSDDDEDSVKEVHMTHDNPTSKCSVKMQNTTDCTSFKTENTETQDSSIQINRLHCNGLVAPFSDLTVEDSSMDVEIIIPPILSESTRGLTNKLLEKESVDIKEDDDVLIVEKLRRDSIHIDDDKAYLDKQLEHVCLASDKQKHAVEQPTTELVRDEEQSQIEELLQPHNELVQRNESKQPSSAQILFNSVQNRISIGIEDSLQSQESIELEKSLRTTNALPGEDVAQLDELIPTEKFIEAEQVEADKAIDSEEHLLMEEHFLTDKHLLTEEQLLAEDYLLTDDCVFTKKSTKKLHIKITNPIETKNSKQAEAPIQLEEAIQSEPMEIASVQNEELFPVEDSIIIEPIPLEKLVASEAQLRETTCDEVLISKESQNLEGFRGFTSCDYKDETVVPKITNVRSLQNDDDESCNFENAIIDQHSVQSNTENCDLSDMEDFLENEVSNPSTLLASTSFKHSSRSVISTSPPLTSTSLNDSRPGTSTSPLEGTNITTQISQLPENTVAGALSCEPLASQSLKMKLISTDNGGYEICREVNALKEKIKASKCIKLNIDLHENLTKDNVNMAQLSPTKLQESKQNAVNVSSALIAFNDLEEILSGSLEDAAKKKSAAAFVDSSSNDSFSMFYNGGTSPNTNNIIEEDEEPSPPYESLRATEYQEHVRKTDISNILVNIDHCIVVNSNADSLKEKSSSEIAKHLRKRVNPERNPERSKHSYKKIKIQNHLRKGLKSASTSLKHFNVEADEKLLYFMPGLDLSVRDPSNLSVSEASSEIKPKMNGNRNYRSECRRNSCKEFNSSKDCSKDSHNQHKDSHNRLRKGHHKGSSVNSNQNSSETLHDDIHKASSKDSLLNRVERQTNNLHPKMDLFNSRHGSPSNTRYIRTPVFPVRSKAKAISFESSRNSTPVTQTTSSGGKRKPKSLSNNEGSKSGLEGPDGEVNSMNMTDCSVVLTQIDVPVSVPVPVPVSVPVLVPRKRGRPRKYPPAEKKPKSEKKKPRRRSKALKW